MKIWSWMQMIADFWDHGFTVLFLKSQVFLPLSLVLFVTCWYDWFYLVQNTVIKYQELVRLCRTPAMCSVFKCGHLFCLQDYPKLSQSYYALLECLAQDHMGFISGLEPSVFLHILSSISEGLTALGKYCCACMSHWLDYTGKLWHSR